MPVLDRPTRLNGLDLGRLFGTVDAFKCDPSLGRFVFRARNRWLEGPRSQSRTLSVYGAGGEQRRGDPGFLLESDAAPVLLGEDRAAGPQEHLLHALCACLTATLVAQASSRGLVLDAVETLASAELDLAHLLGTEFLDQPPLLRIEVAMTITSAAETHRLDQAVEAMRQVSPVLAALSIPVQLTIDHRR